MKRMVVYVKRLFFMYMNPPALEPVSGSGFEPIPHVHYVPAVDEPSLFGNGPEGINHRYEFDVGLEDAHQIAVSITGKE